MSLVNDNRTHTKKVIHITTKVDLVLSDDLIAKINTLHKKVPNGIEWSSILLYRTIEGSIRDIANWKIEAYDLIPMDVGTAGYTEYNYSAGDTYASDRFMDAMMDNNKIGHIHTHHTMSCFFSGVDTSELHDNSPSHAYYLSLIVNYRDPSAWCAKVAFCCTETASGTIQKSYKYIGDVLEGTNVDVEISNTEEIMYTVDCNILTSVLTESQEEEFLERINSLNAKRLAINTAPKNYGITNVNHTNSTTGKAWTNKEGGSEGYAPFVKKKRANKARREDDLFQVTEVSTFLKIWLIGYVKTPISFYRKPVATFISEFDKKTLEQKSYYLDKLQDQFEELVACYFDLDKIKPIDAHCVSLCILDIMQPYNKTEFFKSISDMLDVFIISNVLDSEVERLTGLKYYDFEQSLENIQNNTEIADLQSSLFDGFDEWGHPIEDFKNYTD